MGEEETPEEHLTAPEEHLAGYFCPLLLVAFSSPSPSTLSEASFQNGTGGLGFTAMVPPGLVYSESGTLSLDPLGSDMTLYWLEQVWRCGGEDRWGTMAIHLHPNGFPLYSIMGQDCLLNSAPANQSHLLLCSWNSPLHQPSD